MVLIAARPSATRAALEAPRSGSESFWQKGARTEICPLVAPHLQSRAATVASRTLREPNSSVALMRRRAVTKAASKGRQTLQPASRTARRSLAIRPSESPSFGIVDPPRHLTRGVSEIRFLRGFRLPLGFSDWQYKMPQAVPHRYIRASHKVFGIERRRTQYLERKGGS